MRTSVTQNQVGQACLRTGAAARRRSWWAVRLVRLGLVAGFALTVSACAVDLGDLTGGDDLETDTSVSSSSSSTSSSTTSTTVAASPEVGALRNAVGADPALPPDVVTFVDNATDQRLDEVGELVCNQTTADMSASDFGSAAIVARDSLTDDERALLDLAEFGTAFRVVADVYCPDQVPGGLDVAEEAVPDSTMPPGTSSADISGYRVALPTFLPEAAEAIAFVEATSDERLDELQRTACEATSPDFETNEEFGLVVFRHYADVLTDQERAMIAITPYAEMFGSMVGWFCPERLPAEIPADG